VLVDGVQVGLLGPHHPPPHRHQRCWPGCPGNTGKGPQTPRFADVVAYLGANRLALPVAALGLGKRCWAQ
jgi:hypothetical protein